MLVYQNNLTSINDLDKKNQQFCQKPISHQACQTAAKSLRFSEFHVEPMGIGFADRAPSWVPLGL